MKKFITLIICITTIVVAYFYSCQKGNPHEGVSQDLFTKNAQPPNKLGKSAACPCTPNFINTHCNDCVQSELMLGHDVFSYNVMWRNCTTENPNGDCTQGGVHTKLTFCYANTSDCSLYMEVDSLPPCIQCATPYLPYCMLLKEASCQKINTTDYRLVFDYVDPFSSVQNHIDIVITNDPTISFDCTDSQGYKHHCDGVM